MTLKELKEAFEKKKVYFGIKQSIKNKKNISLVYVPKDCRPETIDALEKAGIEFEVLKTKSEISKNLDLGFESEVYSLKK